MHRPPVRAGALLLVVAMLAGCGAPPTTPVPPTQTDAAPTATADPTPAPTPSLAPTPLGTPVPTPEPTPSLVPADLTGLLVAPELAHRLPIAVMIDDARVARPQSGFNAASIVYQATADGYETRYMFVYQETEADDIGPVRSARFFLVQWAQETRSVMAHYGGDQRSRTYLKYHSEQFTDVEGYIHIGDTELDEHYAKMHGFEFVQVQTMDPHPWMLDENGEVQWGPEGRGPVVRDYVPPVPEPPASAAQPSYDYSNG